MTEIAEPEEQLQLPPQPLPPLADEKYILAEADRLRASDPAAAKCFIITARSLFPDKFSVHLIAYNLEKEENNYQQAAKCFSYICSTFPNMETWKEFCDMLMTLHTPEAELTNENEFFLKMFPFISYDVQQKLILTGLQKTESILTKSKLLLMTFQRFPQVARAHSSHLLELLADGALQNQAKCREMLVEEALPLYFDNPPEVKPSLICHVFTLSFDYCIRKILKEDIKRDISDHWRKIFKILWLCSRILNWETFPAYRRAIGHRHFWEKLVEFCQPSITDATHILFHATTLFIYSLHCYMKSCNTRLDDADVDHVLVEGFTGWTRDRPENPSLKPPKISFPTATNEMTTEAFVHAAKCWQLLNTERHQKDFNKLLLSLPLKNWIARFLFDLSIYFGHQEEAKKLLGDITVENKLIHNLQLLSLTLLRGEITLQSFDYILNILAELPSVQGKEIDCLTINEPRHMIFLPLTQRALVQYCAKAIVKALRHKVYAPACSNQILGDVLILSQIEYPYDTALPEHIFSTILTRRSFIYPKLLNFLIVPDFLEEFYYIANSQQDIVYLEITMTTPATQTSVIQSTSSSQASTAIQQSSSQLATQISENEDVSIEAVPSVLPAPNQVGPQDSNLSQSETSLQEEPMQQDVVSQVKTPSEPASPPLFEQGISDHPPAVVEQQQQPSVIRHQQQTSRRSSRCSEKTETNNYRSIFKHQIARANENLACLIASFITQEQVILVQNLFGSPTIPAAEPPLS